MESKSSVPPSIQGSVFRKEQGTCIYDLGIYKQHSLVISFQAEAARISITSPAPALMQEHPQLYQFGWKPRKLRTLLYSSLCYRLL